MKRYGYLFEKITDINNIILAHKNARKKKTHYAEVKMVDADVLKYAAQIKHMLESGTYKTSEYEIKQKLDKNKIREIYKLPYYPDRIVHHAIMQVLEPIWKNSLVSRTYQSIKGRGPHKAIQSIKRKVVHDTGWYYMKIDIKKYYPSISNELLKDVVRQKIKCARTITLLDGIVDSCNGVPIGNYISQYFGNIFLSSMDHRAMTIKDIEYYRYCDDIVVLSKNKGSIWYTKEVINRYLKHKKLVYKQPITHKINDSSALDFLGYKVYSNRVLLRKSIKLKALSSINNSNLHSYIGWLQYCNGYNLTNKLKRMVNDTIT